MVLGLPAIVAGLHRSFWPRIHTVPRWFGLICHSCGGCSLRGPLAHRRCLKVNQIRSHRIKAQFRVR
jgi:hypothetical protein